MIEILKYIILGIVQGVTEALPISSSGHLLIIKSMMDVSVDFDTLAIITNFGSLLAVIIVFWKDIIKLFVDFFGFIKTKKKEYVDGFKYSIYIVLGCIPAGIAGLIVKKFDILNKIEDNVKFVGIALILTSIMLFIIRKFEGKKTVEKMTPGDALKIGSFQILGLLPGISRSGSTIVGSMIMGLKRDDAFKYSFIMYVPISLAAAVLEIKDLFEVTITSKEWLYYGVATLMAFIFTLLLIKLFRKIVNEGKLIYFSIYCLLAGILVILFL